MRISTNYIYSTSEVDIGQQYQRISQLQSELSTGILVSSAKDDPVAMASINTLQSKLDAMIQSGKNALTAKTQLQTEQTQLSSYENIIEKIRTIINRSNTGGRSKEDFQADGRKVQEAIKQIIAIANSRNQDGDSIFAGTKKSVDAYKVEKNDQGDITGVTYQGNDLQEKIDLDSGVSVHVFQSGDQIFGKGTDSIFNVAIKLANELKSGKPLPKADVTEALKNVSDFQDKNSVNLSNVEDDFGIANFEMDMHNALKSNYTQMLSKLRDADYTKTVSELSKQMTFLKATMSASMQVEKLSIFNQD